MAKEKEDKLEEKETEETVKPVIAPSNAVLQPTERVAKVIQPKAEVEEEEETDEPVRPSFINKEGVRVNAWGKRVDKKGNLLKDED